MAGSRTLGRSVSLAGLLLLLGGWTTNQSEDAQSESQVTTEYRKATRKTDLRVRPASWVQRFARVNAGDVFEVVAGEIAEGKGCSAGWLKVAGGGWACASHTEPTDERPVEAPRLIDGLLPFFYAHRASNKAFSFAFIETNDETVTRPSGREHPANRYGLHDPSDFSGIDLSEHPLPTDTVPAFTARDGVRALAPIGTKLPTRALHDHTTLLVRPEPNEDGLLETVRIDDEWMRARIDPADEVRIWHPAPPPDEVGPDEVWIDIDVSEQMLAVRRGPDLAYVTLISGGTDDRRTPLGIFHIDDKEAYTSMGSSPTSPDQYFVESVPWTMYFAGSYAIHGAYWHNEFGNQRSHGCVNLAPKDARAVYNMVGPRHQPGFFKTWATEANPGSVVRIRASEPDS